jgi:hypothetical protein
VLTSLEARWTAAAWHDAFDASRFYIFRAQPLFQIAPRFVTPSSFVDDKLIMFAAAASTRPVRNQSAVWRPLAQAVHVFSALRIAACGP